MLNVKKKLEFMYTGTDTPLVTAWFYNPAGESYPFYRMTTFTGWRGLIARTRVNNPNPAGGLIVSPFSQEDGKIITGTLSVFLNDGAQEYTVDQAIKSLSTSDSLLKLKLTSIYNDGETVTEILDGCFFTDITDMARNSTQMDYSFVITSKNSDFGEDTSVVLKPAPTQRVKAK